MEKQLLLSNGIEKLFCEDILRVIGDLIYSNELKDKMIIEVIKKSDNLYFYQNKEKIYFTKSINPDLDELFDVYNTLYIFLIEEDYFFTLSIYFDSY